MTLIIVFSFNRAMQVDLLIKSINERFGNIEHKIAVIFHTTGNHKKGYLKLQDKYKVNPNIQFYERTQQTINILSYLKTFHNWRNLAKYLKFSYLKNSKRDNFKSLLEKILERTDCEYVLFNTDDGYYYEDVIISNNIYELIKKRSYANIL